MPLSHFGMGKTIWMSIESAFLMRKVIIWLSRQSKQLFSMPIGQFLLLRICL